MDEQTYEPTETAAPRERRERRQRTKMDRFKEAYLPVVIIALAVILIIAFIVGSVKLAKNKTGEPKQTDPTQPSENLSQAQIQEARDLLTKADALAMQYDYEGAIATLDSFTGDVGAFPELTNRKTDYTQLQAALIPYTEITNVPNLSFQLLIADPIRAFADATYGTAFNKNYVTTTEFSKILQKLYDNGYVLVRQHDLVLQGVDVDGNPAYGQNTLYLPEGKKPLVLTQTGVNYFTYMVDSDKDGLPDKGGSGFASKLVLDEEGRLVNEIVNADGTTATGDYDLIPILDRFIEAHPDFSYKGARAVIAVTGYDGLFGYRTDKETVDKHGQSFYDEQVAGAKQIANALKAEGYELACYTYDSMNYGDSGEAEIKADLQYWISEDLPILGDVDILVYPNGSDIATMGAVYSGGKYTTLSEAGFRFFIGMENAKTNWAEVTGDYCRQTRRLVSGSRLAHNADIFADLFDATGVLDNSRGNVPK